jgi:hypothetical protein
MQKKERAQETLSSAVAVQRPFTGLQARCLFRGRTGFCLTSCSSAMMRWLYEAGLLRMSSCR